MKTLPDGLLEKMTSALVEELDPEAIYLFGSHAWGEPDEDSDVDLMVIVDEEDARERFEKSVRKVRPRPSQLLPRTDKISLLFQQYRIMLIY